MYAYDGAIVKPHHSFSIESSSFPHDVVRPVWVVAEKIFDGGTISVSTSSFRSWSGIRDIQVQLWRRRYTVHINGPHDGIDFLIACRGSCFRASGGPFSPTRWEFQL